jgi:hypothetical protein
MLGYFSALTDPCTCIFLASKFPSSFLTTPRSATLKESTQAHIVSDSATRALRAEKGSMAPSASLCGEGLQIAGKLELSTSRSEPAGRTKVAMILLGCIYAANVAVWKSLQALLDGCVASGTLLKRF